MIMSADHNILHHLLASCAVGRAVDYLVLQHELMPVPLSLAETNGSLRPGDRPTLAYV